MLPLDLLNNNKTNFVPMGLYDLIQKQISVDSTDDILLFDQ